MSEFEVAVSQINAATCAEDIFGSNTLVKTYRGLLRVVHPDRNGNSPVAAAATTRLNLLYNLSLDRIEEGSWGKRLPLPGEGPISIAGHDVDRKPLVGELADIYVGKDVVVKVARSADDADLLRAERAALTELARIKGPVSQGVPRVIATLKGAGPAGWDREATVLPRFTGFYTATEVGTLLGNVDAKTLVWMFKRLLRLLEETHKLGFVHGAILPEHVLFYPDNDGHTEMDDRKHALRLIDWCYSVKYAERTRLSAWVPKWKSHYPPEILNKTGITPASDIFMAAKLMEFLAGGARVHPEMRRVLEGCTIPDSGKRYQSARKVFDVWVGASLSAFGAPTWHEFNLPEEK